MDWNRRKPLKTWLSGQVCPDRSKVFFWTGRGPFVSGPRAAAKAAVGLRHRPAGQVFSKKKMGGGSVLPCGQGSRLCPAAKTGSAGGGKTLLSWGNISGIIG